MQIPAVSNYVAQAIELAAPSTKVRARDRFAADAHDRAGTVNTENPNCVEIV
jgi:hypothetical protein